jgi:hypothetical protein
MAMGFLLQVFDGVAEFNNPVRSYDNKFHTGHPLFESQYGAVPQ